MKLSVRVSVHERGNSASNSFETEEVGKRISLGIQDLAIRIKEIGPYKIDFSFLKGEDADEISLRRGQAVTYSAEGNAFGYLICFEANE